MASTLSGLVTAVLLIDISGKLASSKSISSSTIRRVGLAIVNVISTYSLFAYLLKMLGPIPDAVPISLVSATILATLLYIPGNNVMHLSLIMRHKVVGVFSSFSLFLLQHPYSALQIITFMAAGLLIGLMIDWHKYSQQLKTVH